LNHWIRMPGARETGVCNNHALQAAVLEGHQSTCGSLVKWPPIGTIQEVRRLYSSRRFRTCEYHNQPATQYHATRWGVPSTWRMWPSPWGLGCKQLLQSNQEAYEYKLGVQTYLLLMLYPLVRLSPPGSRPVAHADSKKVWPAVHGGWWMHWEALAWMAHTLGQPPGPSTLINHHVIGFRVRGPMESGRPQEPNKPRYDLAPHSWVPPSLCACCPGHVLGG